MKAGEMAGARPDVPSSAEFDVSSRLMTTESSSKEATVDNMDCLLYTSDAADD